MTRNRRKTNTAFTLVELMIVVAIIGVLAAVAIPAFSKYIRKSHEPENAQLLNKMWLGSISYYTVDHITVGATALPKQFPQGSATEGDEAVYVGSQCGCLASRKCTGGGAYWKTDPLFAALNLAVADAHAYAAKYAGAGTGTASTFTATAVGDLNCNAVLSQYIRKGSIDPVQGDVKGQVAPFVINAGE